LLYGPIVLIKMALHLQIPAAVPLQKTFGLIQFKPGI